MALVVKDRVQETTTTSGTGTLTLLGALAGFQSFSGSIGNGNTTFYTIYDNTAQVWEVGIGTVGAGTLARTTVLSNSSGTTSPITLAGNTASVFCTYPAEKSINYDANGVATIGEVLGYSDTGIIGSFASTVAGYNQVILQNKSTATNASANFNVSNDAGTAGSNYAELGINSSTFTGSGSFNIAGASYVASASTDLTLGTYGAYNVHFVTNSNTTDAMTIFNDGGISLGGFANPGIANMAASKFVPGYTAVTSAAGTTVLTEDSNYYQNLLGTTTQTFQLPDATTLLVGTTFIFDNDSTGALTITDNATATIDSIPAGGTDYIYLADNSTTAGTWRKHAFIPAAYDFNNSTASFGNANITNAVWNGTTIGTGYGGTGLTSFGAANYALYSTSSSALVAGTLPTAAGGTGLTTYTTGDIIYASATNTLSKLAAGTNGYVLAMSSGLPAWIANPAATSRTVTDFTATAGQTTFTVAYTVGLIDVYRNGVKLAGVDFTATNGTSVVLATGANAGDIIETVAYSALSTGTGVTSFSGGTTGLSPVSGTGNVVLSGTLNVANGGTGLSSLTAGYIPFGAGTSAFGSSSNLFWDSANNFLGVGTTTPASLLTVDNGVITTGRYGSSGAIVLRSASGTQASPTAISSNTNTSNVVGRGYDGTTYRDVASISMYSDGAISSTSSPGYITFGTTPSSSVTATERMRITSAGAVAIGNTTDNNTRVLNFTTVTGGSSSIQSVTVGATDQALTFSTTYATLGERMRITGLGNVGIGTTSPASKLQVNSSVGSMARFIGNNANNYIELSDNNGTATATFGSISGGNLYTYSTGYNALYAGSAERMRIDSSGNVGIGTTSPYTYGLSIAKTTSNNAGVRIVSGTTIGDIVINDGAGLYITNASATLPTMFYTNGSERMRINSSGNLLIGTTSGLGGKLTVFGSQSGTGTSTAAFSTNNTSQGLKADLALYSTFEGTADNGSRRTADIIAGFNGGAWGTEYLSFNVGSSNDTQVVTSEKMRIDSSGNVGIGNTPSGTYKLQVSGIISDSKGDVRAAPIQSKTSAYVLTATDAGQTISITTGGVTVNASVFSAGDMVSIFNNSGSSQTITQGASVTLRLSGTATTGNRTLAQYGVATLLCVVGGATPTFACTGAGLT